MTFIVYALPRSRTFWLSRFLTYGDWQCGHDEIRHLRSMDDARSWFAQPNTGTVETAAAPWWRLARQICPEARVVVVRRPVGEVVDSLMRLPVAFDRHTLESAMRRLDRKLDQIERRVPGVFSTTFDDLRREDGCAAIFEACLPYEHDHAWWNVAAPLNLQVDMRMTLRHYAAYQPQLAKLASIAKHKAIAGMIGVGQEIEGIVIQQEPFDIFYRDSQPLFAEHLIEVGEAPGDFRAKHIELMRVLDQIGALQVTTARCNGRVFGYLMAVISPSLESPHIKSAIHTTFYASREFHGLGMKLQRASIAALRAKGVNELLLHAGVRGSGPRMPALFRRLGAENYGQLFKLELAGA